MARKFFIPAPEFYNKEHAGNLMMHLLVNDVDAWWRHVQVQGIATKYGTNTQPPEDRPWGMRDFVLVDPTGVLWRIGQNIPAAKKQWCPARTVGDCRAGLGQLKPQKRGRFPVQRDQNVPRRTEYLARNPANARRSNSGTFKLVLIAAGYVGLGGLVLLDPGP